MLRYDLEFKDLFQFLQREGLSCKTAFFHEDPAALYSGRNHFCIYILKSCTFLGI